MQPHNARRWRPDGEVAATWIGTVDEAHARRRMIASDTWVRRRRRLDLSLLAAPSAAGPTDLRVPPHLKGVHGRVEDAHMLIEKTRRQAHGFTNLDNYRRRLIGRIDIEWHTRPVRRLRGRQPRFIPWRPVR